MKKILTLSVIFILYINCNAQYLVPKGGTYNNCLAYRVNVNNKKMQFEGFVIDVKKQSEFGNFNTIYPVDKDYDSSDFFVPDIETIYVFEKKLLKIERKYPLKRYIKRNFKDEIYYSIKEYALEKYIRQYFAYEYEGKKYLYVNFKFIGYIIHSTVEELEPFFTCAFFGEKGKPKYYNLNAIYDIENETIIKYTVRDE